MIKILITIFIFVSSITVAFSQTEESTTESNDSVQILRLYIEVGLTNGTMLQHDALMLTVNGGFIYNRFYLGGFGTSLINDIPTPTDSLYYYLDMGFGGLSVGYNIFSPESPVSLVPGINIGMGTVSVSYLTKDANGSHYLKLVKNSNSGILVPSLRVGYNLLDHLTFSVVGAYRLITGYQDVPDINQGDFNGFSYGVSLKLEM